MSFDVQAYLQSLSRFGIKPGLERIEALLTHLGHPERSFWALHVGGTNGKGSISSMASSVLTAAGVRVGLYTSPHLSRYNERIRIGGRPISDPDLEALFQRIKRAAAEVKQRIGTDPTEFEVGTAAAFLYFAEQGVEGAVVEVGLGGRLDSTNVVESKVVALGPTALDHTAVLGPDLTSIAGEKAGIFRPGVPAVLAPQPAEASRVFRSRAAAVGCPLWWVDEQGERSHHGAPGKTEELPTCETAPGFEEKTVTYEVSTWGPLGGKLNVTTPSGAYRGLEIPLLGLHQLQNAAVTVGALDALRSAAVSIPEKAVFAGLRSSRWPGRLERVAGSPRILLDGVHNPGGAEALARSFGHLFPHEKAVFVMAILGEKDVDGILAPLLPLAARIVFTRPRSSRTPGADPDRLAAKARAYGVAASAAEPAERALSLAQDAAGPDGLICVCGSLYLVGEIRTYLGLDRNDVADKERTARMP